MSTHRTSYFNDQIWNHATALCNIVRKIIIHQDFSNNIDLLKTIDNITYLLPSTISKADACSSARDSYGYWNEAQNLLNELLKLLSNLVDSDYLDIKSFRKISLTIKELAEEIEISSNSQKKKLTQSEL